MMPHIGNPPGGVFEVLAEREEGWVLVIRPEGSNKDWLSLKLYNPLHAGPKGNFWLGWSTKKRALARTKSTRILLEKLPEVHDWLLKKVADWYDSQDVSSTESKT